MKSIVIADSRYGNTMKIATAIGEGVATHGETKVVRLADLDDVDWSSYDLIVYGSPTHAGRASQPSQDFFNALPSDILVGKTAVAFDTSMPKEGQGMFIKVVVSILQYAAPRIGTTLKSKGAQVVATESFFVTGKEGPLKEGELERAKKWGASLPRG